MELRSIKVQDIKLKGDWVRFFLLWITFHVSYTKLKLTKVAEDDLDLLTLGCTSQVLVLKAREAPHLTVQ